jgi:hypothetical protein
VKTPWYHIGIDFVGPITPPSPSGNCYILTICDYCTKWAEAFATSNKSAPQTAQALFKLFMRMGIPRVTSSDQGREFNNHLNKQLMTTLNIKHRLQAKLLHFHQEQGFADIREKKVKLFQCFVFVNCQTMEP